MASQRCSTCGISYPTGVYQCKVCDGKTSYIANETPDDDWQDVVERAKAGEAGRGTLSTTEEKVETWRASELERFGLDPVLAAHVAGRRHAEGGYAVDLDDYRRLVGRGCAPATAVEILL